MRWARVGSSAHDVITSPYAINPPRIPETEIPMNMSASAPRRGRLGCSGVGAAVATEQTYRGSPPGPVPRETAAIMREWTVASGLLETPDGVLLVRNVRRGGFEDWSTPGGVIDAEDADVLAGLTREVEEE